MSDHFIVPTSQLSLMIVKSYGLVDPHVWLFLLVITRHKLTFYPHHTHHTGKSIIFLSGQFRMFAVFFILLSSTQRHLWSEGHCKPQSWRRDGDCMCREWYSV